MGLTDIQRRLIVAIAQNDMKSSKKLALECLVEDKTEKNKRFCNRYKDFFEASANNLFELPQKLKNIIYVEDVSVSFKEGRYYLSDREKGVFDSIIRMKKVSEKLMEMSIPYLNATLLHGESGTGKTTFGKYIAYKMNLPFCYLNFSKIIDSKLGQTSQNISEAFSYALYNPCVFMLDELDGININRASDNLNGSADNEFSRITISLMQELDKLPNDVIILGATNMLKNIDNALLRRFSLKHEIKVLNEEEKEKMVKKYLKDINFNFSDLEIEEVVKSSKNQAVIITNLIQQIAKKLDS